LGLTSAVVAAPSFSNCFINANCCRSDIGVLGGPEIAAADDEDEGVGEPVTEVSI